MDGNCRLASPKQEKRNRLSCSSKNKKKRGIGEQRGDIPLPQIGKKMDQYRKKSAAPEVVMTIPERKKPKKT